MKNFIQHGDVVTVPAPTGGLASGAGALIGVALFGVAAYTAAEGADVELRTCGVFDLVAEGAGSGQGIAIGGIVYWDATNKRCTATSASNTRIGVALATKATTATSVRVLLD